MLVKRRTFALGTDASYGVHNAAGVSIDTGCTMTSSHMSFRTHAAVISAFLFVLSGSAQRAASEPSPAPFPIATVHMEQNATDGDKEVVFQAKADTEGLVELDIRSPDGRAVIAFKAPDASTLGMRQFRFETPEPPDSKALQAAFPEGAYEFFGRTTSGAKLVGKSTLNHRLRQPPLCSAGMEAECPSRAGNADKFSLRSESRSSAPERSTPAVRPEK